MNHELTTEELLDAAAYTEEDIHIDDHGDAYYCGRQIASRDEDGAPDYRAIREWMDHKQWWPNVWEHNDHGNMSLLSINEDGSTHYWGGLV